MADAKSKKAAPAKDKPKPKPQDDAKLKAKEAKAKEARAKEKERAAEAAAAPKPEPKPRPPADPRVKLLKKFQGRFLPKGELRDRHKALLARWNSGPDHGGVTVEELKSLLDAWKAARAKTRRAAAAS